MPLVIVEGPAIQQGESLSNGVDCTAGKVVRITMSEFWDDANITFQISSNGDLYNDLFDRDGEEVMVPCIAGVAVIVKGGAWTEAYAWVKIRSGSRDAPVKQSERREFAIALEVPEDSPISRKK